MSHTRALCYRVILARVPRGASNEGTLEEGAFCEVSDCGSDRESIRRMAHIVRELEDELASQAGSKPTWLLDHINGTSVPEILADTKSPLCNGPDDVVTVLFFDRALTSRPIVLFLGRSIPHAGQLNSCRVDDIEATWRAQCGLQVRTGTDLFPERGRPWSDEEERRLIRTLQDLYGE